MNMEKWPGGLPRPANRRFPLRKSVNPWFEIYEIHDDTLALLEPHHDEEVFSFLLLGKERAALIDTGMGIANIRDEVETLTSLPVTVINTHTHFDHTGDNVRFEDIACFDDAAALEGLKRGFSRQFCKDFMHPGSYRNLPAGFDPAEYRVKPSRAHRVLHHLDQFDLGGRTLTIHHTPGHSPDSLCIEDSKHKILFTGDTYYRGALFLQLPGSDAEQFVTTVEYLHSLLHRIDHLCPSHNECVAPKEDIPLLHQALRGIMQNQRKGEIRGPSRHYELEYCTIHLPL